MAARAGQVWRATEDGLVLTVRLTPKSARDAIEGVDGQGERPALRARVRAVPEKGRANASLEKLVAAWLGLPASRVRLEGGGKSRLKVVAVDGDPDDLAGAVESRLAAL